MGARGQPGGHGPATEGLERVGRGEGTVTPWARDGWGGRQDADGPARELRVKKSQGQYFGHLTPWACSLLKHSLLKPKRGVYV